jgi:hypothetical protein
MGLIRLRVIKRRKGPDGSHLFCSLIRWNENGRMGDDDDDPSEPYFSRPDKSPYSASRNLPSILFPRSQLLLPSYLDHRSGDLR